MQVYHARHRLVQVEHLLVQVDAVVLLLVGLDLDDLDVDVLDLLVADPGAGQVADHHVLGYTVGHVGPENRAGQLVLAQVRHLRKGRRTAS